MGLFLGFPLKGIVMSRVIGPGMWVMITVGGRALFSLAFSCVSCT